VRRSESDSGSDPNEQPDSPHSQGYPIGTHRLTRKSLNIDKYNNIYMDISRGRRQETGETGETREERKEGGK